MQHHPEEMGHHEFNGANELGYGHEWEPSFAHEFHGGGYQPSGPHYESHAAHFSGEPEYAGHHESFGGYD